MCIEKKMQSTISRSGKALKKNPLHFVEKIKEKIKNIKKISCAFFSSALPLGSDDIKFMILPIRELYRYFFFYEQLKFQIRPDRFLAVGLNFLAKFGAVVYFWCCLFRKRVYSSNVSIMASLLYNGISLKRTWSKPDT